MKKLILLISMMISASFPAQAQIQPSMQRQELFVRAYKSLSFLIFMASDDKTFSQSLTSDEMTMLKEIGAITTEVNTVNWLRKNKIQQFGSAAKFIYAYTIPNNKVVQLITMVDRPIQIQFSDDQSLFLLNPDQPVRSAMTETAMNKDIFINLAKINDATNNLDLANAVSLLIHEYGHKLGPQKIQNAVDSFAAKMENFIRSSTSTVEIGDAKINILKFNSFPFQLWVETLLFGADSGPGKPRDIKSLSAVDGQGTYVWVDDGKKVTDITDTLLAEIQKKELIRYEIQAPFHFVHQKMIQASKLSVEPTADGSYKFKFAGAMGEMVLPFMQNGSVVPEQYRLYQKAFQKMQPWRDAFIGQEMVINKNTYSLKSSKESAPEFTLPNYKIEFLEKRQKGTNLEIFYRIEGDRNFPGDLVSKEMMELWPEITIQINSTKMILKASNFYEDSQEFKFKLENFPDIADQDVKIVGIQFKLNKKILANSNGDITVKTFLPAETILATKKPAAAAPEKPQLKSIQIWNGKNWVPLRQKTAVTEGMHLRFIFIASEKLRQLNIDQNFNISYHVNASSPDGPNRSFEMLRDTNARSLRFDSKQMRQTQQDQTLYVDVNIDHDQITEYKAIPDDKMDEWYRQATGTTIKADPNVTTEFHVQVLPERRLSGLSVISQSGAEESIELKSALSFIKTGSHELPAENNVKMKPLRCQRLF